MIQVAIIGTGNISHAHIHAYMLFPERVRIAALVDIIPGKAQKVKEQYGLDCDVYLDHKDILGREDITLVDVCTPPYVHAPISINAMKAGKNVICEKPMAPSLAECDEMIRIARERGVTLAVFQQTFLAPFYGFAYDTVKSGILGEIKQISIRYNGLARRWDWQTLQKKCAGSTYNTGPHPIGMGLGFLDFDANAKVVYGRLDTALTSGDADDYAKILIAAPGKPLVDIEISAADAYPDEMLKIQGSKGTLKANPKAYEMTYLTEGENPDRPVQETFLQDEKGNPAYCSETLIKHVEGGKFNGTAFDIGTAKLYEQLYYKITENRPMTVTPEMAAAIVSVIETVHAANPLPLKY